MAELDSVNQTLDRIFAEIQLLSIEKGSNGLPEAQIEFEQDRKGYVCPSSETGSNPPLDAVFASILNSF